MESKVTIDINDSFSLMNIRRKKDYDVEGNEIIKDLQKCFQVVDSTPEVFMFKDYDAINEVVKVSYTSEAIAKSKLKKLIIGKYQGKNSTAWDIYTKNVELFTVKGLKFYSEDPDIFSYFRGYDFKQLDKVKEEIIQPFLSHVHDVIADGNEEIYKYILVWIASILQKPSFKTETAIVILGHQGTGKNSFFTNVICKLMARYANENVTNIESIVGKFNATLENKKLLILNELQSVDMNKFLNSDALKSVITDKVININQKNEPMRVTENVANFIMVSNNSIPVKIDSSDRRYMVTKTSDKYKGNFDYFEKLNTSFTPEFYENLFTFFMTMNIKDYNLRRIPNSEAKETIKEASMSSYEIFARDNYELINNISGPDLFNHYCDFVNKNHYQQCSSRTFISNIIEFTGTAKAKRIDGKVTKVYNLLPDVYARFKKYHDDLVSSVVEDTVNPDAF